MAAGADGVLRDWRINGVLRGLRGLDDFAGAQAAGADPQAPDAAVHHRPDPLQVRLEPPGGHIVCVADVAADDRPLVADFTALRHGAGLQTGQNANNNTVSRLGPRGARNCHPAVAIWIDVRIIASNSGKLREVYGLQPQPSREAEWTIRSSRSRSRPSTSRAWSNRRWCASNSARTN